MTLTDLHCDTLLEAYHRGKTLTDNDLHFDLAKTAPFDHVTQVLAIFSEHEKTPDECYLQFDRVVDYYESLSSAFPQNFTPILAVEGGKLLDGKLNRLSHLYRRGVRIFTLVWGEISCMGGAFEYDLGLTDFGREVVSECFSLGILPDVSHASVQMTEEAICMAERAGKPLIASHSCFSALNPHKRNLSDDHARRIGSLGGIVGVNLVRKHLSKDPETCDIDTVIAHILHGVKVMGENAVSLGCDLDGTSRLPSGIADVGDLETLYDALLKKTHSQGLCDKVFSQNAQTLMKQSGIIPL